MQHIFEGVNQKGGRWEVYRKDEIGVAASQAYYQEEPAEIRKFWSKSSV